MTTGGVSVFDICGKYDNIEFYATMKNEQRKCGMLKKGETDTMKMYIAANPALCSGCRCCELACSLFHFGECNPELAGLNVIKDTFSDTLVLISSFRSRRKAG